MTDDMVKRFRFSVPKEDISVLEWIDKQNNLGISLRMLIGDAIERAGYADYMCRQRVPNSKKALSDVQTRPVEIPTVYTGASQSIQREEPKLERQPEPRVVKQEPVREPVKQEPVREAKREIKPEPKVQPKAKSVTTSSEVPSDDDIFNMFNS